MGHRLSKASRRHGLASNKVSFVLAGTGIPEYSGDSRVIQDSGVQPKGETRKKNSSGKNKNPKDS